MTLAKEKREGYAIEQYGQNLTGATSQILKYLPRLPFCLMTAMVWIKILLDFTNKEKNGGEQ